ncbi:MAG TPA: GLPGLI family protein [Luteibaculaceae bacterium]|nr:GLPGLI family protein [Luteibaculaceae bacterium]
MKWASNIIVCFTVLVMSSPGKSQISAGRVVYERKTNLYKKFKNDDVSQWIPEANKIKIDTFELIFNDTLSYFGPVESNLKENLSWATNKNRIWTSFNQKTTFQVKEIFGEPVNLDDSLRSVKWKIVPGKRKIAGYECQKALYQHGDTANLYAWFCPEFITTAGPETFNGLPGLILGLATEDGGVIYFARQVLLERVDTAQLTPSKIKGKKFTKVELRTKLEKDFGKEEWGKMLIGEVFGMW